MFDIPVGLFIFKRTEKSVQIMKEIGKVRPKRVYIISDAGRNEEEQTQVDECRAAVEHAIDWECEVVKKYAESNRGCFGNIGLGALEIFEKEEKMIFLEDDNFPAPTFFDYCKELLEKYEDDDEILWICGTNYMTDFVPSEPCDYVFTRHLLPCGWASWSKKFRKYYDYDFKNLNKCGLRQAKKSYISNRNYRYDKKNWLDEKSHDKYYSWDYQMNFSIRYYGKFGIAPCKNQITNIGVDGLSAHGGNSMEHILTSKFCMVPSDELKFPLHAPSKKCIDRVFEKKTERIIVPPRKYYLKIFIRRLIPISRDISIKKSLKERRVVRKGEE